MGYQTAKGLPIPFGYEGNNVPGDILALAQRMDDILSPHTYAEISALGGANLWDGRVMMQTDTGALRPWAGLYCYRGSTALWEALVPTGGPSTYSPLFTGASSAPVFGAVVAEGRWSRFGSFVMCDFFVQLPASGFTTGTGTVQYPLPVPFHDTDPTSSSDFVPFGWVVTFKQSTAGLLSMLLMANDGTDTTHAVAYSTASSPASVGISPSQAFINSDAVYGFMFYEAVEG